jgi:hypothetical protein
MVNDSRAPGEQRRAPASSRPSVENDAQSAPATDAALSAIGYEAADPSLQSAYWAEILQADTSTRNLR